MRFVLHCYVEALTSEFLKPKFILHGLSEEGWHCHRSWNGSDPSVLVSVEQSQSKNTPLTETRMFLLLGQP